MSRRERDVPRWRTAVAVTTAVMVVGATGAVAAFGLDRVPAVGDALAGERTAGAQQTVTVPAAQRVLVCPPGARLTDGEAVGDGEFDSAPVDTASSGRAAVVGPFAEATFAGLDGKDEVALDGTGGDDEPGAVVASRDGEAPMALRADPDADAGVRSTAAVRSITTSGDLRGLAAASCSAPSISQWLVGGSTELGSSSRLVLQNAGTTPANVRMTVYGPAGVATVIGSDRFVVPPGDQVETLVESGAPEQKRLVVHLESEGGLVSGSIQHSTVSGIVAHGVDLVGPGAAPSTRLAVPGVLSTGEAVGDDDAPVLRLLAPGGVQDAADADAGTGSGTGADAGTDGGEDAQPGNDEAAPGSVTATITAFGSDGAVTVRGAEEVSLDEGSVLDVDLGGLPADTYTIVVDADAPVVAGAMLRRSGEEDPSSTRGALQYDLAWISAAGLSLASVPEQGTSEVGPEAGTAPDPAPDLGSVALPSGVHGVVSLGAADGPFAGTLTAFDSDGAVVKSLDVAVEAGRTSSVDVDSLGDDVAVLGLVGDGGSDPASAGVAWNVLLDAGPPPPGAEDGPGSFVSSLTPVAPGPAERSVTVRETEVVGEQSGTDAG
ncbi:hypothetical protein GCM10025865_21510 [Paraoerskovia sediminicola]|uniref:Secreted protein n=1 Tax=Paraoerskovia sediminicola TaxID=1138587 RepID=A0ABM8G439_9CELL|nr:DUF5719 family protein [Paraoerskovia sediminicola]BDZ42852.1 hypothetical protein GCM10025865_21510 [Paraoerskovia sediminicola]